VTEPGTVADVEFDESVTSVPPEGAMPFNVMVPVEEAPPMTVVGLSVIAETVAGSISRVEVADAVPTTAVMSAKVTALTIDVLMVTVAVVCPAAKKTELGRVAAGLSLERFTVTPEGPAGPVRVTVPVTGLPPTTGDGL